MSSFASEAAPRPPASLAARLVATWFFVGHAPVAPGTLGTLATVPLYLAAWASGAEPWVLAVASFVAVAIGVPASTSVSRATGQKDPKSVVIDEVAGFLAAGALLPFSWTGAAVAFVLFRLLDVTKPWPIRAFELLPRGWGIVLDDVVAGWISAIVAWAAWSALGRPPLP